MRDDNRQEERDASGESAGEEEEASFFHKVRSDVFRRKVEGVLKEGVFKNIVSEMKLPREIMNHLTSQIDDTKQATLKLVGKEVRQFFENTNLAEEMANLLSQLSFEVSTKVRFVKNDPPKTRPKKIKLSQKTRVKVLKDDDSASAVVEDDGGDTEHDS